MKGGTTGLKHICFPLAHDGLTGNLASDEPVRIFGDHSGPGADQYRQDASRGGAVVRPFQRHHGLSPAAVGARGL